MRSGEPLNPAREIGCGNKSLQIGIVAGETSGDYLAAGLMRALKKRFSKIEFSGIGGPCMQAEGLHVLYPMEQISIMGLDELARSLFTIITIRRNLFRFFTRKKPALFIGVDVPDFNLGLEEKLKKQGIATVHYVSPTVWAWRSYRIRKIRRAVSHMLTLFPFEADFYRLHNVSVDFVGHPIADEIGMAHDRFKLRNDLQLQPDKERVVAILPGSRMVEVKRLGSLFIQTAHALQQAVPNLQFVAPFANPQTQQLFSTLLHPYPQLPFTLVQGKSRQAIAASDVALVASGTAALEAALLRVPMVVAYKGSWVSYLLVRMLAHVDYFSMPNNLLPQPIVPELIQAKANVNNLVSEISRYLLNPDEHQMVRDAFSDIITSLRCGASEKAADAVCAILATQVAR